VPKYSNLYLVERRFGGPEEGGWHYEHFTFIRGEPYSDETHARLDEEARVENEDRRPLHSVLSTGLHVVIAEDEPGASRPTEPPTYQ
jgi:hypothetical protein